MPGIARIASHRFPIPFTVFTHGGEELPLQVRVRVEREALRRRFRRRRRRRHTRCLLLLLRRRHLLLLLLSRQTFFVEREEEELEEDKKLEEEGKKYTRCFFFARKTHLLIMSIHGFPFVLLDALDEEKKEEEEEEENATKKRKRNKSERARRRHPRDDDDEEEEEEEEEESPLLEFLCRYNSRDIVEKLVLSKLDSTSVGMFARASKETRRVVNESRRWSATNRTDRRFSTDLKARDIETKDMLVYALEKNELQKTHRLVSFFAGRGRFECVKYLLEEEFRESWGIKDRQNAFGTIVAAKGGHFKCLKYLVERGRCALSERACAEACGIGSLKILRYCRNHFAPWNNRCLERASLGGHKDIVLFLLKHRAPIQSANPAIFAAEGGHLDIVEILYNHGGVLFDERVAEQAAEMGYLDILKFIVEKNLPWHWHSCMQACLQPSEYVRDEYYDRIEEIKARHVGVREWMNTILPMPVETVINDNVDDEDSMDDEEEEEEDEEEEDEEEEDEEEDQEEDEQDEDVVDGGEI